MRHLIFHSLSNAERGGKPALGFDTASSNNRNADGLPVPRLRLHNLLPPSSVHAQTRSLTLNRPTALIHMPPVTFLAVIDLSWPLRGSVGVSGCQLSCTFWFMMFSQVFDDKIQTWCIKRWLITLGSSQGKAAKSIFFVFGETLLSQFYWAAPLNWNFFLFFFFFTPSDMNKFVIENSTKGFSRSSSTQSHRGGRRATRRSP